MTHLSKFSFPTLVLTFALALSLAGGPAAAEPKGKKLGAETGDCMQGMEGGKDKATEDCLGSQMQHQDEMKQMHEDKNKAKEKTKGKGKK